MTFTDETEGEEEEKNLFFSCFIFLLLVALTHFERAHTERASERAKTSTIDKDNHSTKTTTTTDSFVSFGHTSNWPRTHLLVLWSTTTSETPQVRIPPGV